MNRACSTVGRRARWWSYTTYKNCIVIPQEATVQLQDKTVVYKVVDGKAVSALITVAGINDGREYVVLDGLEVGDEIVSTGLRTAARRDTGEIMNCYLSTINDPLR